jgi:hypothetical protein
LISKLNSTQQLPTEGAMNTNQIVSITTAAMSLRILMDVVTIFNIVVTTLAAVVMIAGVTLISSKSV